MGFGQMKSGIWRDNDLQKTGGGRSRLWDKWQDQNLIFLYSEGEHLKCFLKTREK